MTASRISWRTGSTRWQTESGPSAEDKKLERQDKMQESDSARTVFKVSGKIARFPHDKIWAFFRNTFPRIVFLFTFRRTLESPRSVKQRSSDILKKSTRCHRPEKDLRSKFQRSLFCFCLFCSVLLHVLFDNKCPNSRLAVEKKETT